MQTNNPTPKERNENIMSDNLTVSYAPHIRKERYISTTMRDVLISLLPATVGSVFFFGYRSLLVILTTIIACVLSEFIWNKACKKENTVWDLSAVVTGTLLAMTLPPSIPFYMAAAGGVFAIIIVKCFFGGIGQNIVNPALAARAFLLASWPVAMTNWTVAGVDTISGATPLAAFKSGVIHPAPTIDLFLGTNIGGSIGEVSALLLLIGGIYLIARKVITPVIPVTYIATVGLFGFFFTKSGLCKGDFLFSILSGGVFLGGIFMATDYTTSPLTAMGQFVYAIGAGIITGVIRVYGGYPEGVTYAILIMNVVTPLIDKVFLPKKFGKAVKAA